MNLFESIYYDLLIEGKTPEQILEMLRYKFPDVPEVTINKVFELDPTKKKSYTYWVLSNYGEEKHIVDEFLKNGVFEKMFNYAKEHQEVQLNKYSSIKEAANQLLGAISNDTSKDDNIDLPLLKKEGNGPEDDFTIEFRSDEWIVAIPNTYEADHKLGENTHWCTAGWYYTDEQGRMYYRRYLRDGGCYFINFDLRRHETLSNKNPKIKETTVNYPFTRYQFHFESNQFMDADDDRVNMSQLDMPDDVISFYQENGHDFDDVDEMSDEERMELYQGARYEHSYNLNDDGLMIMPEYDYDMNPNISDDVTYMVYNTNYDEMDPITYTPVSIQPLYLDVNNDIYILNKKTDGHDGLILTNNSADVDEFDGTSYDEPLILIPDNDNNYDDFESIVYYKVEEAFSTNTLFFITNYDGTEFWVVNKYMQKSISLPFADDYFLENNSTKNNVLSIFENSDISYNENIQGRVFEIVYGNGYHSLLEIGDEIKYLIKMDKPYGKEDHFTEGKDENGNMVIFGTIRNYFCANDYNKKDTTAIDSYIKNMYFNDTILVRMNDGKYNVYNVKTKQLILPQNFDAIKTDDANLVLSEKYGVVIVSDNKKYMLYSLTTGEQLSKPFPFINCGELKFYGFVVAKTEHDFYVFSRNFKETYGPFNSILGPLCNAKTKIIVTVLNDGVEVRKVLNLDTGQFEFENISGISLVSSDYYIASGKMRNGDGILFNIETGDIILKDFVVDSEEAVDVNGSIIRATNSSDRKMNMYVLKTGEKLLPFDVDYVYGRYNTKYEIFDPFVILRNGNTFYLYNTNDRTLLPSENGITTGDTGVYGFNTYSHMPICRFIIHDSQDSPTYYVLWNYNNGEISVQENGIDSEAIDIQNCTPEVQQRVMQVLYPQRAQFVAQYNEMIRRMKNLIR